MTEEEYRKLVELSNEIHRKTMEADHYIEIPIEWLEELDANE